MCTILTQLAYHNPFRCVYHCEHNTIHLTWDNATTYMDLETLAYVVELIEQGDVLERPGDVQYGLCRLFFTRNNNFQIWIRNVGLRLSRADFEVFASLIQEAFEKIMAKSAKTTLPPPSETTQYMVNTSGQQPFSNN